MNLFLLELLRYVFLLLIYIFLYRVISVIIKDISTSASEQFFLLIKESNYNEMKKGDKLTFSLPLKIGKSSTNDIIIKDSYISQEHISIYSKDGSIWIEDHGTTNGTTVNGLLLKEPCILMERDIIDLAGAVIMEFGKNR